MSDTMTSTVMTRSRSYYTQPTPVEMEDPELEPYASLFLKPFTNKKCAFTKQDLEVMCADPLHSRKLILYLINFIKHM